MFSFFQGLLRKGPGSEESTLRALQMLDDLAPLPRVVEFGCGSGVATLVLAKSMKCTLSAVEIHRPFLDQLQALAARDGVSEQITPVQADMADPPFPDQSFDLIWSEAAIYNIGFEKGLRRWRRLVPSGGYVAVTEVAWLTPRPPEKARDFWQAEYPAITSIEENLINVRSAGFEPVGHFVLPSKDWEDYYTPLEKHLATFRTTNQADEVAQSLADSLQHEVDLWRECGSSFGYVFYVAKAI
jgi:ubiquinone/menaquinone biosynthesis C-methylase UbiE